jgi:hypothetical protein
MTRYATIGIFLVLIAGPAFAQNPYYDHGSFPTQGSLGSSAAMRAELDLIEAGFAKLPALAGNGNKVVVVNSAGTALTTTTSPVQVGTAFPSSPTTGQLFVVTDDSAIGACDSGSGSAVTLCIWDDSNWLPVSSGAVPSVTLGNAFDNGKIIDGANSLANAVRIGDGTTPLCLFTDATLGPRIKPCTDSNTRTYIENGFTWCIYDIEGDACMFTIDPDAASRLLMYQYGANYRPLKSVWIGAGGLYGDGTNCPADPTAATINSGPKIPTFICADNSSSILYGAMRLPDDWDGGTLTFQHVYVQTAADTNAVNGDVSAQCRGNGETPSSTWGTAIAIDDAAVTGSNANDMTTSASVTPAGTCAAGDMLYFRYVLDATGTTTATATLHHLGFYVKYTSTSWSH